MRHERKILGGSNFIHQTLRQCAAVVVGDGKIEVFYLLICGEGHHANHHQRHHHKQFWQETVSENLFELLDYQIF
jgi:hypothetical protein